ncbi:MAG: hypothetical protein IIC74_11375 [Bacteroidetes bacterium]|nr:hypothetical protein [Bacteroidota bacterium]
MLKKFDGKITKYFGVFYAEPVSVSSNNSRHKTALSIISFCIQKGCHFNRSRKFKQELK